MKIDNYITHLELRKKGLKNKCNELLDVKDPYCDEITEIRKNLKVINKKLNFLKNLRKGMINCEMQNKKK